MARSVRSFLALLFIVTGVAFLAGTQTAVSLFDQIGWGDWLRYASGMIATLGGIILLVPSRAVLGTSIATAISLVALLIQAFLAVGSPVLTVILTFLSGGSLVQAQLDQPIATHRR